MSSVIKDYNWFQGKGKNWTFKSYTDCTKAIAKDISGAIYKLTIRDEDDNIIVEFSDTIVDGTSGVETVTMTDTQAKGLIVGQNMPYDIERKLSGGIRKILFSGSFKISKPQTRTP